MRPNAALALFVAAQILLGAAPAYADKTLDLYRQFCEANEGDNIKAIAAADKAGWMPMPDVLLSKLGDALHSTGASGRILSTPDGLFMLLTSNGAITVKRITGKFCVAAALSVVPADFDRQVADFAGVPVTATLKEGFTVYAWRTEAGGRTPVTLDDDNLKSFTAEGKLRFLMTKHDEKMSLVMMITPTGIADKSEPPATAPESHDTK